VDAAFLENTAFHETATGNYWEKMFWGLGKECKT
jgi:hypothetical protein